MLCLALNACVTSPSANFQSKSVKFGLVESSIKTPLFELAVFDNVRQSSKSELHVYLEGDGVPFIQNRFVNTDPTSIKATALSLINQDQSRSILVGRPCYHGKLSGSCSDNKWWTSHRYNLKVVEAMSHAINSYNSNNDQVVLIGFSGGGTLAMLIADKINALKKIVTISANLDTNAWTHHHAFSPLSGSLNPMTNLFHSDDIAQLHLLGEQDKNIPYWLWADKLKSQNSTAVSYPDFTHSCCWSSVWPKILKVIDDL